MYLHLGNDISVRAGDVVGIFDLDTSTVSRATRDFLTAAEKGGRVVNVTGELPKSFVVCGRRGGLKVYITQISSAALRGRFEEGVMSAAAER